MPLSLLIKPTSQNKKDTLLGVFCFGAVGGIRFSAEKPRRLQQSTGLLLRAAFRIPPSIEKKNRPIGQFFFSGAVGGIRTLGPLLTVTRFPVVLVMTTSILLHLENAFGGHRPKAWSL